MASEMNSCPRVAPSNSCWGKARLGTDRKHSPFVPHNCYIDGRCPCIVFTPEHVFDVNMSCQKNNMAWCDDCNVIWFLLMECYRILIMLCIRIRVLFSVMWSCWCESGCALRSGLLFMDVEVGICGGSCRCLRGEMVVIFDMMCMLLALQGPGPDPESCWWIWRVGCFLPCRANGKCWSQVSGRLSPCNCVSQFGNSWELDFGMGWGI